MKLQSRTAWLLLVGDQVATRRCLRASPPVSREVQSRGSEVHSGFSNYLAVYFHFLLHTALYLPSLREEQASCLQPGHSEGCVLWATGGAEGQAVRAGGGPG